MLSDMRNTGVFTEIILMCWLKISWFFCDIWG